MYVSSIFVEHRKLFFWISLIVGIASYAAGLYFLLSGSVLFGVLLCVVMFLCAVLFGASVYCIRHAKFLFARPEERARRRHGSRLF